MNKWQFNEIVRLAIERGRIHYYGEDALAAALLEEIDLSGYELVLKNTKQVSDNQQEKQPAGNADPVAVKAVAVAPVTTTKDKKQQHDKNQIVV
jgi:hypothetical protein